MRATPLHAPLLHSTVLACTAANCTTCVAGSATTCASCKANYTLSNGQCTQGECGVPGCTGMRPCIQSAQTPQRFAINHPCASLRAILSPSHIRAGCTAGNCGESAAGVTLAQFSAVFLGDSDKCGSSCSGYSTNPNTQAVVSKHWGFFKTSAAALWFSFQVCGGRSAWPLLLLPLLVPQC